MIVPMNEENRALFIKLVKAFDERELKISAFALHLSIKQSGCNCNDENCGLKNKVTELDLCASLAGAGAAIEYLLSENKKLTNALEMLSEKEMSK